MCPTFHPFFVNNRLYLLFFPFISRSVFLFQIFSPNHELHTLPCRLQMFALYEKFTRCFRPFLSHRWFVLRMLSTSSLKNYCSVKSCRHHLHVLKHVMLLILTSWILSESSDPQRQQEYRVRISGGADHYLLAIFQDTKYTSLKLNRLKAITIVCIFARASFICLWFNIYVILPYFLFNQLSWHTLYQLHNKSLVAHIRNLSKKKK